MINWARVAELKSDMGAEGFDEVVELFMTEIEEALTEMARHFPDSVKNDLHFLKGSAANIGFEQLRAYCLEGEADPNSVDPSQVAGCYFDSKKAFLAGLQAKQV